MKAHVQYSQSLAAELNDLIQDYEDLVESPEDIVPEVQEVQEEVDLEAICAVFEELMDNEPISVLRALTPNGVEENAEEAAIEPEAVEQLHEDLIPNISVEESHPLVREKIGMRRSSRIKKRQLPVFLEGVTPFQCSISLYRHKKVHTEKKSIRSRTNTGKRLLMVDLLKRFGKKSHLNDHTRVHSKRFTQISHLNYHSRYHLD